MAFPPFFPRLSLDTLLPPEYLKFSKVIHEGFALFLSGLPVKTQHRIFTEQAQLPAGSTVGSRLVHLAKHSPVLHKIGQTLARNQHLPVTLRQELQKLEWLAPSIPRDIIETTLNRELGSLRTESIELAPQPIAEASVAVVIPFGIRSPSQTSKNIEFNKVFKLLKPDIEETLLLELELLKKTGTLLDEFTRGNDVPSLGYRELFLQVTSALQHEICLEKEQHHLKEAAEHYKSLPQIKIPELLPFCSSRVTAMERIFGKKLDAAGIRSPGVRTRLARQVIEALIVHPVFSPAGKSLFHGDPHGGNLLYTGKEQLAIIDWSQAGYLRRAQQQVISKIILAAHSLQQDKITDLISEIALTQDFDRTKLGTIVRKALSTVIGGTPPGFSWLIKLFDHGVVDAGIRFPTDLLLFRKSLLTITGIVAELTGWDNAIDSALTAHFWQLFAEEWPTRWLSYSFDGQRTHLSNSDLWEAAFAAFTTAPSLIMDHWQARSNND